MGSAEACPSGTAAAEVGTRIVDVMGELEKGERVKAFGGLAKRSGQREIPTDRALTARREASSRDSVSKGLMSSPPIVISVVASSEHSLQLLVWANPPVDSVP